jgi:hypothetical protein
LFQFFYKKKEKKKAFLIFLSLFFSPPFFFFPFFLISKKMLDRPDGIPHRTSSYQRLKEKLKRNPTEKVDTSKWPRPKTPQQVLHHAVKGGLRK